MTLTEPHAYGGLSKDQRRACCDERVMALAVVKGCSTARKKVARTSFCKLRARGPKRKSELSTLVIPKKKLTMH